MMVLSFMQVTYATESTATTRQTNSGHIFTQDHSLPALGDAWRDESGMIWGDIVWGDDGLELFMDQYQAEKYCQNIGAELPSRGDFARLRSYMGATEDSSTGYSPQILPHLSLGPSVEEAYRFWTSSIDPFNDDPYFLSPYDAYFFDGLYGAFGADARNDNDHFGYLVRCVRR